MLYSVLHTVGRYSREQIFEHIRWHRWSLTIFRCRPYYTERTGSLLNSEVKRCKARLVLGSGTAWEPFRVLTAFFLCLFVLCSYSNEQMNGSNCWQTNVSQYSMLVIASIRWVLTYESIRPLSSILKGEKKLFTLLDLCVSSLRRGHANLLCIVPILTDGNPCGNPNGEWSNKSYLWALSTSKVHGLHTHIIWVHKDTVENWFSVQVCSYVKQVTSCVY